MTTGLLMPVPTPTPTGAGSNAATLPARTNVAELAIGVSLDIPPYVINDGAGGVEIEILRAALEGSGYRITTRQMPYGSLDDAVDGLGLDAAATVLAKDDGLFYSDNYITFRNFAITRSRDALTLRSVEDLQGKSVAAWQNAHQELGPAFEAMFSPEVRDPYRLNYQEIADQTEQVRMFWNGQVDVIVIDEAIFCWLSAQLANCLNVSDEPVYHRIFPEQTELSIGFRDEQVRDEFNAGLRRIRQNGAYQRICARYHV